MSTMKTMLSIQLTDADVMADTEAGALEGTFLYRPHYDRVIRDTTTVLKPDGSVLFGYKKDAIPRAVCQDVFTAFKSIRIPKTDNRGMAAGGERFQRQRPDGTMSDTTRSRSMRSAVVGFLDRNPRSPLCRMTSFTRDHPAVLDAVRPLAVEVDRLFQQLAPERWQAQHDFVNRVAADWVIHGTVFTSVTVNDSERMSAHMDAGDYRPGFGVMAVLEGGRYFGGELIFSKYRTAVDMRTGGVFVGDVHAMHGNAPIIGTHFKRLAFVFYVREKMDRCGTVEEERLHAARKYDI